MSCRVYINDYQRRAQRGPALPKSAAALAAQAQSDTTLEAYYDVKPPLLRFEPPTLLAAAHQDPGVAVFYASVLNEALSLHVAAEVKRRHPGCLIVFGGTRVPKDPRDYMERKDFIDVCIGRGGGDLLRKVLLRHMNPSVVRNFSGLPGITWRSAEDLIVMNTAQQEDPRPKVAESLWPLWARTTPPPLPAVSVPTETDAAEATAP